MWLIEWSRDLSPTPVIVAVVVIAVSLVYAGIVRLMGGDQRMGEAPFHRGFVPHLGYGWALSRYPLTVLAGLRRRAGDVFTLLVTGKRVTFVFDPDAIKELQQNKSIVSKPVYKKLLTSVFHVEESAIEKSIHILEEFDQRFLNGEFLVQSSAIMQQVMGTSIKENLDIQAEWSTLDLGLNDFTHRVVYESTVEALFGRGFFSENSCDSLKIMDYYIPLILQGYPESWIEKVDINRRQLLEHFSSFDIKQGSRFIRERTNLLSNMVQDKRQIHLLHSALLWESIANLIPTAFWTIYMILKSSKTMEDVIQEIGAASTTRHKEGSEVVFDFEKMPILQSVILEVLRLKSYPISTFVALDDTKVDVKGKSYALRNGDQVSLCQYAANLDGTQFLNPHEFHPKRFIQEKAFSMEEIDYWPLAHAGSIRPGLNLILLYTKVYVSYLLYNYELKLVDHQSSVCLILSIFSGYLAYRSIRA
eukprot:TRINITY_DN976_c0_g1_i2.p1 TRINITY_DN976_c0_g1~~TRINITY_DN976_c0_g1_i2.p1  ORF type:complete len:475 (-),score=97.60 TRINITY_DN976_c0_g1_i2:628-2052(-)